MPHLNEGLQMADFDRHPSMLEPWHERVKDGALEFGNRRRQRLRFRSHPKGETVKSPLATVLHRTRSVRVIRNDEARL
jgi:hypothetical protein